MIKWIYCFIGRILTIPYLVGKILPDIKKLAQSFNDETEKRGVLIDIIWLKAKNHSLKIEISYYKISIHLIIGLLCSIPYLIMLIIDYYEN